MEEAWGRFGDSQEAEEKQRKYCFKPDKVDYMDSDTFHVYTDPMTKYKDILAPEVLNLFSESERKIIGEMDLTDDKSEYFNWSGSEYFNWNGLLMHGSAIDIRKITNLVGLSIVAKTHSFR